MRKIQRSSFDVCIASASRVALSLCSAALALAVFIPAADAASKKPYQRYSPPQTGGGIFGSFDDFTQPKSYRVYGVAKPRPQRAQPSEKSKTDKQAEVAAAKPIKGPLVLTVSLAQQRVTVHDIDGPIAEAPISSGQPAFPTLTGVFSILEKSVVHHSNLYDGAPMPNMQRLTWSGTAMHAGHLPGYPASHGCIRLPYNFSKKLYGMTKLGTRVIVTRDALSPAPIKHANLITPLPPETDLVSTGALGEKAGSPATPTKVAENVDYESVRSLSLISPAAAAETPLTDVPAVNNARSQYRAARAAELAKLEADLKAAEAEKTEAEALAKRAAAYVESAKAEAAKARAEAERRIEQSKKLDQAWLQSNRALEAHARKFSGAPQPTGEIMQKAIANEMELEAKTAALADEAQVARLDAERAEIARSAAESNILVAVKAAKSSGVRLTKANSAIRSANAALESFRKAQSLRKHPVSVFISRSTKRLYVRQAYEPIFDVPVTIDEPDALIGTHVFTALEYLNDASDMRWSVVSIPTPANAKLDSKDKSKKNAKNAQKEVSVPMAVVPGRPPTATSALDRITIPDDARERIADVLKPGSSIIISDYGISHQTGKYTDFIILTR